MDGICIAWNTLIHVQKGITAKPENFLVCVCNGLSRSFLYWVSSTAVISRLLSHIFAFVERCLTTDTFCRITQKVAQIFYCVPVELKDGKKWYWVEDTKIVCSSPPHKYLAIFAGIPLLVFVCMGFPITLFVKLYRRRSRLHTDVVVSRYGYFYQGYDARCAYWGVLVQARKALLAVISVLSHALSEQLKGDLFLFVLLLALGFHICYNPHKERKLNRMESASLLVSCIVCVLRDMEQTSEGSLAVEFWLTTFNVVLIIGFVVYMAFEVISAYRISVIKWLREDEEQAGNPNAFLKISIRVIFSQVHLKISCLFKKFRSWATIGTRRWILNWTDSSKGRGGLSYNDHQSGIPLIDVSRTET